MKKLTLTLCALGLLSGQAMASNPQDILNDMERERAAMVSAIMSAEFTPQERGSRIDSSLRRLADMERMVLRDDKLMAVNTSAVRRAFANYDLTFLVHASAENNRLVTDHWMEQVGLSTASLMTTQKGRR